MSKLIKFADVEQFRNVLRNIQHKAQFVGVDSNGDPIMNRLATLPKVKYEGTVKIHGSNMSIRIEGDKITCQSRNNEIDIVNDCYGFAKFIAALPIEAINYLKSLFGDNVVIFGEEFGKGIQDTVGVSQLDKKWAIFRVQTISDDEGTSKWITLTDKDLTPLNKYNIYSIRQFGVKEIEIDFEHPADDINKMNEWVMEVENECPVAKWFGISGIGEGLVFSSVEDEYKSSKYVYKCKGAAHSKSKVTKLATIDTVKLKSIDDFVERYVDEGRCQQAYDYLLTLNKPIDEKLMGDYLRWLVNDINKEESDTIAANGLTPKDINGAISKQARKWYFGKLNKNVGLE